MRQLAAECASFFCSKYYCQVIGPPLGKVQTAAVEKNRPFFLKKNFAPPSLLDVSLRLSQNSGSASPLPCPMRAFLPYAAFLILLILLLCVHPAEVRRIPPPLPSMLLSWSA